MAKTASERKEYYRLYREANRVRIKEKNAAYYQRNKERHRDWYRAWKKRNPKRVLEIRQKWRDDHPDRQLLHNAKMRSRVLGVPFNITIEDVVVPTHCPVLGIKLIWTGARKKNLESCPSLDRIIPKLGYVKGNVQVISWRANWLKRDGTLEEFEKLVSYLRSLGLR